MFSLIACAGYFCITTNEAVHAAGYCVIIGTTSYSVFIISVVGISVTATDVTLTITSTSTTDYKLLFFQ